MTFRQNLQVAFSALMANKLRSLLTMLGIIIGVAAVVSLVSIGEGVQNAISDEIEGAGEEGEDAWIGGATTENMEEEEEIADASKGEAKGGERQERREETDSHCPLLGSLHAAQGWAL